MWKPKPITSQWTDEQWQAITEDGRHILVAAAAGSGKTAVLVERIIEKLLDEQPIDIDKLLVVTFTNAAAAEMRARIRAAIEKKLVENPDSIHLRRQLLLLNKASISTIHSFCIEVIRKYYYMIDIDPMFRIGNKGEMSLLKEEVLNELLEEQYEKNNKEFLELVEAYTNDRNDEALQEMILGIHEFSISQPHPDEWVKNLCQAYELEKNATVENLPYFDFLRAYVTKKLQLAKATTTKGKKIAQLPDGPHPRVANFEQDAEIIDGLLDALEESWESLYEKMNVISFGRLAPKKKEYDENYVLKTQELRESVKEIISKLAAELFFTHPYVMIENIKKMFPHVQTISELVRAFSARLQTEKKAKALYEFSDLEHYALEILQVENGSIAEQYKKEFAEILVDEYQDVNKVQEAIVRAVAKDEEESGNLFMVGDVKQSIYRFRMAEPSLFLDKYARFTGENHTGLRIDLAKNFRSHKEIIDGVNFIFKQIMDERVGEINYDENAELKYGATHNPDREDCAVELVLLEGLASAEEEIETIPDETSSEELGTADAEGRFIAMKIRELMDAKFPIHDKKGVRPIEYHDIVILVRSKPWVPQMVEQFQTYGIPVQAESTTNYFAKTEVAIMLSLLKIIDNPRQDIPLVAVLRSPLVQLDENELTKIRLYDTKNDYYSALKLFLNEAVPDNLYERVQKIYTELQMWRKQARSCSLSELITTIYFDTQFLNFVGAMPNGEERQANLQLLYDKAKNYEVTSSRGLFDFLLIIERMEDEFQVASLGVTHAVKIMTIHGSKGLEFPVVFVSGLGRNFNMQDLRSSYLLDKEQGFASYYVDTKKRVKYDTLTRVVMRRKKKSQALAEEMRTLYVALTRPKEKLYLVGTAKDISKKLEKWTHEETSWLLPDDVRESANNYLDWIVPAIIRHQSGEEFVSCSRMPEIASYSARFKTIMLQSSDLIKANIVRENKSELIQKISKLERLEDLGRCDERMIDNFNWLYPHSTATFNKAKQSVSELKRQMMVDDADNTFNPQQKKPIISRPNFMQQQSLTASERGTAMHMVMRHVPQNSKIKVENIKELVAKLVGEELLTSEQAKVIDAPAIVGFFESSLGERFVMSANIEREIPFSMAISASELYNDSSFENETVLVQGVIDCLIEDEDGLVLIDFKTDRVESIEEIKQRYNLQINLYRRAVETIYKRKIAKCFLYLFDGQHIVEMG